jgi:hypothetical protein
VEERIGLVFSWDPRAQHWVKERGPDDAPPPPADPIDNEAVQTYFLDPQTGRWNGTILGLKARQMTVALGAKYRNPRMVGLAIIEKKAPRTGGVPTPDQKKSPVPMMAGLAAVVVVIAAGAFAAQAVMKPKDVATDPAASAVASATPAPEATAAQTDDATPAPTEAPTQTQPPTRTAPPRTPAPTAPPQTVVYSSRLANGNTVSFSGPGSVIQNTAYDGTLSLRTSNGSPGSEPITLYFGQLGTAQTLTLNPDRNGNYFFSLKVSIPRGTQSISVSVGKNGEIRTLGTVTVR